MRYRKLGQTDMEVSVICQGCWSIVTEDSTWGGNDPADSLSAIRAGLDAGVNFFDTARGYGGGESEEMLAEALGDRRKEVFIATKLNDLSPDGVRRQCENSLRRLKSDYIDLYQIHWPRGNTPVEPALEAMTRLRQEGKIRAIGVSNFGVSYMRDALPAAEIQTNQLCYSLLWRAIEHEVQPLCLENHVGILPYSPLAQGLLTGKFSSPDDVPAGRARTRLFSGNRPEARHGEPGAEEEVFTALEEIRRIANEAGHSMTHVALAWLLAQAGVTSVIAGSRNPDQATDNADAGDVQLSDEVIDRLSAATEPIKQKVGTNCDMWQHDSRMEK